MPSTRKQRAKERRPRQVDLMSDTEILDIMLSSYSRNELESNSVDRNDEMDCETDRTRHDLVQNSEAFRSLLNSNSRENSESTVETMRLVSSESSKQMDGLRKDLNSQIIDAMNSVINEKVLPEIRNTMTSQNPVFRDEVDHRSNRLSRTAEEENTGNAWNINSKPILANSSKRNYFRENSDVSQSSDEGHDQSILEKTLQPFYYKRPVLIYILMDRRSTCLTVTCNWNVIAE